MSMNTHAHVARLRAELDALQRSSVDEQRARQNERLAALLRFHFASSRNPAYRQLVEAHGIAHADDLPRTVDELHRLPVVTRAFLQEANYAGQPGVPADEVQKTIETSGTAGNPLHVPYTYEFVRRGYQDFIARAAILGGMNPLDRSYWVVHWEPNGRDVWSSHVGARAFAAGVGPERAMIVSTHTALAQHWQNLAAHQPVWAASAPAFFMAFAGYCEQQGLDLASCSLQRVMLGGATLLIEDRRMLERAFGLERAHMFYPSTEALIIGSELDGTTTYLCFEDEVLVELVDQRGQPVKPGEQGRVLLTHLANRGFPVIRYAIGDVATYVGPSSDFAGFKLIAEIRRIDAGEIGDARLPFSEIEMMPRQLLARGIPVRAIQVARRRRGLHDVPVFRIETSVEDRAAIERALLDIFRQNPQMRDMLDAGVIHPPVLELYAPGQLSRGRLKVPVYVDERGQA
jgi:phenylacetate-CoA ligase